MMQQITPQQYIEKKAAGLARVAKVGKALVLTVRRFSPENGQEAAPDVIGLSIQQLEEQKAKLQQQIDDLNILINDLKALNS